MFAPIEEPSFQDGHKSDINVRFVMGKVVDLRGEVTMGWAVPNGVAAQPGLRKEEV